MTVPGAPQPRWIELAGAVNVRDLAGAPTVDGRVVRADRLIRADNLQGLRGGDVRRLVDDHHVRTIVDLRTDVEAVAEGPGPMTRESSVHIVRLSLLPKAGDNTDAAAAEDGSIVLPWQARNAGLSAEEKRRGAAATYLRYLDDRAESVITALRLIAGTDGATVVHCAAGKDRTGVVIAFALAEVGVAREEIVADYARSAERIEAIYARLRASDTYAHDLGPALDRHRPRAETMADFLDAMDELHGGVPGWLRAHGWTEADASALRHRLLD